MARTRLTPNALRLLLVEDSCALARELRSLLSNVPGEEIVLQHVETLGEALRVLARESFDCLLVDLHLPDSEGLTSIDRLRGRAPDSAIVALSGPDEGEYVAQALRRGAQEYLVRPWLRAPDLAHEILRLIRQAIERKARQNSPDAVLGGDEEGGVPVFPRSDEGAYALSFQPWAELDGGTICGVEALLGGRPGQGSPRDILRAAESRGSLDSLSHWVLRRAAPTWLEWRARKLAPPRLSVNIAPSELHARHFARSRLGLIEELGLSPNELQIELAEDALLGAGVKALGELQALRSAGIAVVADNVGHSQVALLDLARLPLDGIKLDIALIEATRLNDGAARAAIRGLVAMCNERRVSCCAVGVEIAGDYASSRELGVHLVQGYWVARPQTAVAAGAWLARCMPSGQRELNLAGLN